MDKDKLYQVAREWVAASFEAGLRPKAYEYEPKVRALEDEFLDELYARNKKAKQEDARVQYGVRLAGPKAIDNEHVRRCSTLEYAQEELNFFNSIDLGYGAKIVKRRAAEVFLIHPASEWVEADER